MEVDFNNIEKNIAKTEAEIKNLRAQVSQLLILTPELAVVVDPDESTQALDLQQRIKALKMQNEAERQYRDAARRILQEHDVLPTGDNRFNIAEHISNVSNSIHYGTKALGQRLLAGQLSGSEYDSECIKFKEPLEKRITELQEIEKELEKIHINTG